MCPLYIRVLDIREWYFDQVTNRDLYTFYSMDLKPNKQYSFEELVTMMTRYVQLLKKDM